MVKIPFSSVDDVRSREWLRLSDLISDLPANPGLAEDLFGRLDPDVVDELHAVVAHRKIELAEFVIDALTQVAVEAADAAWRNILMQRADFDDDPEAAVLGQVLRRAMQSHLHAGLMIASEQPLGDDPLPLHRIGHPYKTP